MSNLRPRYPSFTLKVIISQGFAYKFLTMGTFDFTCPDCQPDTEANKSSISADCHGTRCPSCYYIDP